VPRDTRGVAEPLPASRSYEGIAEEYEQARGGVRRARELVEAVARWLKPGSLIIDVGAGTAIVADELRNRGHRVIPLDISPSMLRRAAGRFPGQVLRADGQALPLRPGTVDVVLFVWSLHHVGEPVLALREARQVLRRGGRIVAISGLRNPADDDMQPVFARLESLRPAAGLGAKAIRSHAERADLRVSATGVTEGAFDQSPRELASQIEQRLYAPLWDLDETEWHEHVQPVIDDLLALPDPDRQRRCQSSHPLLVLEPDAH